MSAATYLVGGAVRDELLGLPVSERDWVVTGSTPDALLEEGFRQVGAAFPVFLHPQSGEEYALARTERKSGHGYHGFTVDFHPGVTLEEDLARRDLTINAMARDAAGRLIDPFGGKADLEARVLRHVSPAFVEDPLRVLRVARFAARFAGFGFQVHPQTLELMRSIAAAGELQHLAPERVWTELTVGLATAAPRRFIEVLREAGALAALLPEVDLLFGVPQNAFYHPEVDTGLHVLLALDCTAAIGAPVEARFAVLLHDLGKALSPRASWPAHIDHDRAGVPLVRSVCERLRAPVVFRQLAEAVCALHLRCHDAMRMRPGAMLDLLESADLLRRPERLEPFLAACEADWLGRAGMAQRGYPQGAVLRRALDGARSVRGGQLDLTDLKAPAIAQRIRQARIEAIAAATSGGPRQPDENR